MDVYVEKGEIVPETKKEEAGLEATVIIRSYVLSIIATSVLGKLNFCEIKCL